MRFLSGSFLIGVLLCSVLYPFSFDSPPQGVYIDSVIPLYYSDSSFYGGISQILVITKYEDISEKLNSSRDTFVTEYSSYNICAFSKDSDTNWHTKSTWEDAVGISTDFSAYADSNYKELKTSTSTEDWQKVYPSLVFKSDTVDFCVSLIVRKIHSRLLFWRIIYTDTSIVMTSKSYDTSFIKIKSDTIHVYRRLNKLPYVYNTVFSCDTGIKIDTSLPPHVANNWTIIPRKSFRCISVNAQFYTFYFYRDYPLSSNSIYDYSISSMGTFWYHTPLDVKPNRQPYDNWVRFLIKPDFDKSGKYYIRVSTSYDSTLYSPVDSIIFAPAQATTRSTSKSVSVYSLPNRCTTPVVYNVAGTKINNYKMSSSGLYISVVDKNHILSSRMIIH